MIVKGIVYTSNAVSTSGMHGTFNAVFHNFNHPFIKIEYPIACCNCTGIGLLVNVAKEVSLLVIFSS